MDLARRQEEDFLKRVCGVFMTDSVHYHLTGYPELDNKLELISKNYVTSDKVMTGREGMVKSSSQFLFFLQDVGVALTSTRRGVSRYSAGHETHEWTSWTAREKIFQDLTEAFSQSESEQQHHGEL